MNKIDKIAKEYEDLQKRLPSGRFSLDENKSIGHVAIEVSGKILISDGHVGVVTLTPTQAKELNRILSEWMKDE